MQGDLSKLIIAFVIGGSLFLGYANLISMLSGYYGFEVNSSAISSISRVNEIAGIVYETENTTSASGVELVSGLTTPYTGVWVAILNILNLPNFINGMITDMLVLANIPVEASWFISMIIIIIGVIILFAVIKVLTGGGGGGV